jgi:hypothetical protein
LRIGCGWLCVQFVNIGVTFFRKPFAGREGDVVHFVHKSFYFVNFDGPVKSQSCDGFIKSSQARRADRDPTRRVGTEHRPSCEEILRNEVYIEVRRNDEGCSATQHSDFLRDHQFLVVACGDKQVKQKILTMCFGLTAIRTI